MVIGANPTDGHPVFASRMKRRLREGAKLIVLDPAASTWSAPRTSRRSTTCSWPPGTNVAVINAMAHVAVTGGLVDQSYVDEHRPADEAASAIANHLRMFWDPRMRTDLITRASAGTADFDPLVPAGVRVLTAS